MASLSDRLAPRPHDPRQYSETPPIPAELSLEIYTDCNQACLFCPNRKQTQIAPRMPVADARRWLREAFGLGVRRVGLHAKGEPFLVRNLDVYVAAASDAGYRDIFLTTNGAAATPARLRAALAAGLTSVKFSINAHGREHYRLIHGQDHYDRVMVNLRAAADLKREFPFSLYVSSVETALTPGDATRLQAECAGLVDEFVAYPCSNFCGHLDISPINPEPPRKPAPCHLPFDKLHITPEGLLTACCGDYQDYLAIADLHRESILAAWHSTTFRALRRRHLDGRLEGLICDACLGGRPPDSHVLPLDASLAKTVAPEYWSRSDIAKLIDMRRKKWPTRQP
jgi:hypothetical protein